jgi:hypothetical protein
MRRLMPLFALLLLVPSLALAAGTVGGTHTEAMDGINGFPPTAHLSENPHSTPVGGCGAPGGPSDAAFESSAYHYFVASGSFTDTPLPPGGCMDVREFWVSWDANWVYLGVQGPNETYERGDLFIAIDTDDARGRVLAAPWGKAVDFCDWDPEFVVALENPQTAGGYAALLDKTGATLIDSFGGLQWADGGYNSCDNGGMYYEFKLPRALLGLAAGAPRTVNFAVYTTYEDAGFDAYDSAPGCGQGVQHEQIGDYPYDGDHCGSNVDCVTGTNDGSCGFPDSDDTYGTGNAIGGRFPASDDSGFERDTIGEYYSVTNFLFDPVVPAERSSWGRVKSIYR